MISLYIHIPFCFQKCAYCNFCSFPVASQEAGKNLMDEYLIALKQEIQTYAKIIAGEQIKSIYIGGGTPTTIGKENLKEIIDLILANFDCSFLAELSIETNPYPQDEILDVVQNFNKRYHKVARVRRSFGLQSFDNQILSDVGRPSSFAGIVDFLRALRDIKQENTVLNFDFIAFGKLGKDKQDNPTLRDPNKRKFFQDFVNSGFAESFSLYTLELFPGSKWQSKTPDIPISGAWYGSEDDVYQEFHMLKDVIENAGYKRYEISNFAKIGMSSIHNRVYRSMENYIGLGLGASSFVHGEMGDKIAQTQGWKQAPGLRRTNTKNLLEYNKGNTTPEVQYQTEKDLLIEKFFLGLRTDEGVTNLEQFKAVLVADRQKKLKSFQKNDYLIYQDDRLILTDLGMDVFNSLIMELLKEI